MKTKIFDGDRRVTSPYGWRQRNGVKEFHNGVDFSMVVNTPLKVPDTFNGAKVRLATADKYGGKYIQLIRSDGKGCYYLHVNSFKKSVGQTVKAGDVIALSGNTGLSTGPHLHFGVQSKATEWGSHEDPMPYIEIDAIDLKVGDKVKIVDGDMNLRQGAGTGFTNNVKTIKEGAVVEIKDGPRSSQNVLFYGKGSTINKNDSYKWIDVRALDGSTGWIAITNRVEKAHGNSALTNFDGKIPEKPTPPPPPPPSEPVEPPTYSKELEECKAEVLHLSEQNKGLRIELGASKKANAELEGQITSLEGEIEEWEKDLNIEEGLHNDLKIRYKKLEDDYKDLKVKYDKETQNKTHWTEELRDKVKDLWKEYKDKIIEFFK